MSSETLSHPVSAAPAVSGSSAARDPFLDNAKFLLVVVVVIGHSWAPLAESTRGLKAAYLFVYAFHMPLFILLCGYFSRGFTGRPEQVRKLVATVLVPYLLFETCYAALESAVRDRPFSLTPAEPTYLCWFLIALFVWRLTAPVWRAVRLPVVVAVAISLAAGLAGTAEDLALTRVLMFLPWFVLGLRLRPEHFRPLRARAARRWALPVLAGAAAGAWWAAPRVSRDWLLMQRGADGLGVEPLPYLAARAGLLVLTAVLVVAFLAVVPSSRRGFTRLGTMTMYPFLLHGLIVKSAEGAGLYAYVRAGGPLALVALTLVAGALAILLCAPFVRRALRLVVEPPFPRFLVPTGTAKGHPGQHGHPGHPGRPANAG
ncbi:acyltransferase family protein [Streptomyces sp. HNM0574]|uniref:acyltransferase family protein n=1 Tax=Streptomyces sp. HNM0574 TaxID=2714954 RepID=UPI00146AF6D9|nr:acyltransferase family protein [Streptomyces sp. HNM0574]NLU67383.1 acyltransferase family protein [Streptomyces sp. HNM0574]